MTQIQEKNEAGALVALALSGVCAFLDLYATQPLLPSFESSFHVSKAVAGMTVSAATAAVAIAAPVVGVAADRLGRKRVIVPAIFLVSIPTMLAATSPTLGALIAWRFLQGLVLPAIFAVSIAYVTEEWAGRGVGTAMAALITGNVIGGFTGRVVTGLVAAAAGWRAAFVVLGVLNIVGGLATWRWLPAATRFRPHRVDVGGAARAMVAHLRSPALVATYAVGFSILFSLVAAFTYVTFYLTAPPFSVGQVVLSWIFVVYLVGAAITPFAGRWIDRVGSRRALSVAFVVSAAGMTLTLIHSLAMVAVGLAVCATAVFIAQSASTSYLQHAAPRATRSSAAGLYVSFYYLGGSVGGVLPALLWEWGGWPACVALVVVAQLGTIVIASIFWGTSPSTVALGAENV